MVILVASVLLASSVSHGVTTAPTTTTGLPLYQFVDTGTQPLPWNAVSLESHLETTTMLGGPHSATNSERHWGVIAYRTNTGDIALYTQTSTGATSWLNYTTRNDVPTARRRPDSVLRPVEQR